MNLKSIHLLASFLFLSFLIVPEARPVTLALVGDLMVGRGISEAIGKDTTGRTFAALTPWIQAADLTFGNLESPVGLELPDAPGRYNLCAPPSGLMALREAGFDLLSTANNHSTDCLTTFQGELGSADWIAGAGMQAVDESYQAVERNIRGVRLAFLAADDISAPVDMPALTAAVRAAHEKGAVVIVSIHWGAEYQAGSSKRQRNLAAQLAEAGARLIVGHHPHVIQPAECLRSVLAGDSTLVLYSLGNALFDQYGLPDTRQGLLALVRVSLAGPIRYQEVNFQIKSSVDGYRLVPESLHEKTCP